MKNIYQLLGINFYRPSQLGVKQDWNILVPEDGLTYTDSQLYKAIRNRDVERVELLLKRNANPNIDIEGYEKPLMIATQKNVEIMNLLIAYGANVNDLSGSKFKRSCLHVAVNNWNFIAVGLLLNDITIDVNVTSSNGNSVLHIALQAGRDITMVKDLLDAGIDISLKNRDGRTAFDSLYSNPPEVIKISKEHIVKLSAASFYVSEKNLALIVNSEEFSEVRNKCMKEIENMKNTKIGDSNFTYYDLLRKCKHKLAVGLKHVPNNIISDLDIPLTFPLYGGMLTYRLRKVLGRKNLLIDVTDLVYDIFNDIRLPSTFTSMIFKYLTNGDLKKLVVNHNYNYKPLKRICICE